MELSDFVVTVFVEVDDFLNEFYPARSLRARGFLPRLTDSEVITMEIVGEYLGFSTDKAIYEYFKRHWRRYFPNIPDRTSFVRQCANLWKIKEKLFEYLTLSHNRPIQIIDSMPLSVVKFERARRARLFRDKASYGKWFGQTYFGFKLHFKITQEGVIKRFILTPANIHDIKLTEDLLEGDRGSFALADKGYRSKPLFEKLWNEERIYLHTSLRRIDKRQSPLPRQTIRRFTGIRRLIETVAGQLEQQFFIKKVWARDMWHLLNRIIRKVLSHSFCAFLNMRLGRSPLSLKGLVR